MQYYGFFVTNGDAPVLSFVARLPDIFPRNGRFDSNLRRLTFAVEPDADSGKDLVLRQNEILKDMDADEQATPLVLARNVKDFVVECWDTNALDWAEEWDSTNTIPPMVRVTLSFGGENDASSASPTLVITREIAVPSITLPTQLQQPRIARGGGGGGAGRGGVGGANNPGANGQNKNGPGGNGGGFTPGGGGNGSGFSPGGLGNGGNQGNQP
jgi:hypothetical protein